VVDLVCFGEHDGGLQQRITNPLASGVAQLRCAAVLGGHTALHFREFGMQDHSGTLHDYCTISKMG
jgi:hypothetical protein